MNDEEQNFYILQEDDRNQVENHEKTQQQKRLQNRNQVKYQDRNQDKEEAEPTGNNEKRALRTSVIKNLLRTYNDLNCGAKDECQDECEKKLTGKKQDKCESKCEAKYECEESVEEEDTCGNGSCGESEEAGSTKGERLVTVTPKCKRC